MSTYRDQLQPYESFDNESSLKKAFNLFRKLYRYELTKSDNKVLFEMTGYAIKFPGVCKLKLETIAEITGLSVATVKRAISKAIKLGILKRFKTRKDNGRRQGTTVYQFQDFTSELQNELQTMSYREDDENPCESKAESVKNETEALISLSPSLSFKDTNITDVPEKNKSLKIGLLNKVPAAIANAISPFMDDADEIFEMVGTIFSAKSKVDKSIKIEAYENEFYKSIVSVFESQKRAAHKEKAFNIFAVMYSAIEKLTKSIVNPAVKTASNNNAMPLQTKELIQQWMIDKETDPTRKAQLQATKDLQEKQDLISRSKEIVPDWMLKRSSSVIQAPQDDTANNDVDFFEQAQKAFRERLASM